MATGLHDLSGSYLPKLQALFYAVFDPQSGPRVVHQVPEGSIATALSTFQARAGSDSHADESTRLAPSHGNPVLFDFSSILDFVIPQPELCDKLVTKATRTSKVLGFPIRIVDQDKYNKDRQSYYTRNTFTFNICFVFDRGAELSAFEPVVRKIARMMRSLETNSSLLSNPPSTFRIADLLEQLYLDINVYSESSAPAGSTTLDLVLFPFYANPPEIHLWDVPVAVVNLSELIQGDWDLTLYKLSSFIDGVNHIRRIAELAQVDVNLARLCIQHLRYYGAVIITDLFQYSNRYKLTSVFADAAHRYDHTSAEFDLDMQTECEQYVYFGGRSESPVPFVELFKTYASLDSSMTVSEWVTLNKLDAKPVDVRRMIQFGVIKGFLKRVHAYPVWLDHPLAHEGPGGQKRIAPNNNTRHGLHVQTPGSPKVRHANEEGRRGGRQAGGEGVQQYPASLPLMLDGSNDTDSICVKYGIGLRQVYGILSQIGGGSMDEAEKDIHAANHDFGRVVMLYC